MKDKSRYIISIILNSLVVILYFAINIVDLVYYLNYVKGVFETFYLYKYRYFTQLANLFLFISSVLVIVYSAIKLKYPNYKVPTIVYSLRYLSISLVTLMMICVISCILVSPKIYGYWSIELISGTSLFTHLINPLIAILSFAIFETKEKITNKEPFYPSIIILGYSLIYLFNTFIIHIWDDFYNVNDLSNMLYIPLVVISLITLQFLVSEIIKLIRSLSLTKLKEI